MDREQQDRLKEIHQTDLTESRIHEEFVDWLKSSGVSWLLVILLALCAYFAIIRWREHKYNYQTEAWVELSNASLPSGLEDVAERYSDVGSVALLARMRAAGQLMSAVQRGKYLGAETEDEKDLTEVDRAEYLNRADNLYEKIIAADDGSESMSLLIALAHVGRASVAEARLNPTNARTYYESAIARVEDSYPLYAEKIRHRTESLDEFSQPIGLPGHAIVTAVQQGDVPSVTGIRQVTVESWIEELLDIKNTPGG